MHAGDVAFAALCGGDATHAADVERFGADALLHQPSQQTVEADAMASDDDQIGSLRLPAQ